jgi:hypothetical protein
LYKAFNDYLCICGDIIKRPDKHSSEKNLNVVFSKEAFLQYKINKLEDSKEFKILVKETQVHYDGKYHGKAEWGYKEAIKNFFRQSDYYTSIYDRKPVSEEIFHHYKKAFEAETICIMYLALMEGVDFTQKINGIIYPKKLIDIGHFQIKKFSKEEMDSFVTNRIRSIFYPYSKVDTKLLSNYWFIIYNSKEEMERIGKIKIDLSGRIKRKYSSLPPAIESLLHEIVLFGWEENPPNKDFEWFFPFRIPLVLQIKDNPILRPTPLPYFRPDLLPVLDNTGTEVGEEPHVWIEMEEDISNKFIAFVKRIHDLLNIVREVSNKEDGKYRFIERASSYLIKAFTSETNLEQLIWHIAVLESLFGQTQATKSNIAKAIKALFGSEEEKKFKNLYQIRSDYIHGNEIKNEVFLTHLREARILARKSLNWFLKLLEIASSKYLPTRDEILTLINNEGSLEHLKILIELLPSDFPALN